MVQEGGGVVVKVMESIPEQPRAIEPVTKYFPPEVTVMHEVV
jgi:hypothetical protein